MYNFNNSHPKTGKACTVQTRAVMSERGVSAGPGWSRGACGTNDVEAGNAGQVSEGQHRGVKTNSTATCLETQSPLEKQESPSSSPPEKTLIGTCTNFHATTNDGSQTPPRKRFPQGLAPLRRLKNSGKQCEEH